MAAPTMADLQLYYSGGGSNSNVTLSIGGAISSARILSQTATAPTTITGVTIDDAMGNAEGDGILTFTYSATAPTLQWRPYAGAVGTAVTVSASGVYFIQAGSNGGGLCVTVAAASLPTSSLTNTITIANRTQKFFNDLTKAETLAGSTKYHCFAIKNTHATDSIVGIKLYIAANTPGADTKSLYLDPLAASNGAVGPTAVANEATAPGGSTFVVPDAYTHADVLSVGTLTAGQCRFFWVKELCPSSVTTAETDNTFSLGIYMQA